MRVGLIGLELEVHAHLAHEKTILENGEDLYRGGCDFDHHVRFEKLGREKSCYVFHF